MDATEQLSVAVAVPIDELEVHKPVFVVMFAVAGHELITGFSRSLTFTVCVHVAVLPLASVSVQVMVCVPAA